MDIGCCIGTDLRFMIYDKFVDLEGGDYIVGVDVEPEFYRVGFEIFEDEDQFRDKFYPCDVLCESQVQGLKEARGPFNVVYCGSVFHLLQKEETETLARVAFELLEAGGVFFGRTGSQEAWGGFEVEAGDVEKYLHTMESFRALLEASGFEKITLELGQKNDLAKKRPMLAFTAYKPL
uniref:Uncharacterized protein n=1 Tax=Arcella intermedia TaxID=1963864 RepID=A0A6B2LJ66_9EUKA